MSLTIHHISRKRAWTPVVALAAVAAIATPAGAATVNVVPSAAAPGAKVTVSGAGFPAARSALVRLGDRTVARAVADGEGNWQATFAVAAGAARGSRALRTAGAGGLRIADTLRVLGARSLTAPNEAASSRGSRVVLSAPFGQPGSTVVLRGAGLKRRAPVRYGLPGAPTRFVRASRGGRFVARLVVPVGRPGHTTLVVRSRTSTLANFGFELLPAPAPPVGLNTAQGDPTIAAAGDIACPVFLPRDEKSCHQDDTANLIDALAPTVVAPLGDEQYDRGTLPDFAGSYQPSWGRFFSRSLPTPGNHEYRTIDATDYFAYFGAAAGDPNRGFYSYDLGAWHVVSLNSNCFYVSCAAGSDQEQWLRADLATHRTQCTLAYWHHPRFSSGPEGERPALEDIWDALYDAGADLVLVGHEHLYERFAPIGLGGAADPERGIREIIVGTGGRSHSTFRKIKPLSRARNNATFGVISLTLHPASYDWQFVPEVGHDFTDSGTSACH